MDIDFNMILVPLSAALGLSLTVERILEFISNVWERLIGSENIHEVPLCGSSLEIINGLEKLYANSQDNLNREKQSEDNQARLSALLKKFSTTSERSEKTRIAADIKSLDLATAWPEELPYMITLVEPARDPDDGKTLKRFVLQVLGFAVGIVLVHYSGVQFFTNFLRALQFDTILPLWLDFLFTGLLIGAGSAPMHSLIRFITTRKFIPEVDQDPAQPEEKSSKGKDQAPLYLTGVTDPALQTWMEISYHGGVDRSLLQGVHLRETNPDMIVYHHTAMHSNSTFEDLVRVIKSQKDMWQTAYNCVVMSDGTVRPYCRWDRFGNHTAGFNRRSLGLAFNGNYETNPHVPFSNPDGRKGAKTPPEIQIKAGARLIVLWLYLYPGIKFDFKTTILAHQQLAATACPGNNFPFAYFEDLVGYYRDLWKNSAPVQQRISEFRLKPYLYV